MGEIIQIEAAVIRLVARQLDRQMTLPNDPAPQAERRARVIRLERFVRRELAERSR